MGPDGQDGKVASLHIMAHRQAALSDGGHAAEAVVAAAAAAVAARAGDTAENVHVDHEDRYASAL